MRMRSGWLAELWEEVKGEFCDPDEIGKAR